MKIYSSVQEELDDIEFKRLMRENAAAKYSQKPELDDDLDKEDETRSDPHI